jgi:hypothetical protein
MQVSQAMKLAGQSISAFEDRLKGMKTLEVFELADNLRFAHDPEAFDCCFNRAYQSLKTWYDKMKSMESKAPRKHFKNIPFHFVTERSIAFDTGGFDFFNPGNSQCLEVLPSEYFKGLLDEMESWK